MSAAPKSAAPAQPAAASTAPVTQPAAAAPAAKPALAAVPPVQQGPQSRRLKKGEHLFNEGEYSRSMYLLKNGMIRIYKKKGEGSIELDTIRSGQVLGELAFLDGNPRSASGEALIDCDLIEISGPAFQATLSQMPDWLKILLKTIVGRLRTAGTRIRQLESTSTAVDYSDKSGKRSSSYVFLGPLDVMKCLAGFILIASRYGKPTADGKGIEMRMGLTTRYMNQIMGVPEAKVTTMTDVLMQAGILTIVEDPADPANSKTVMTDITFLDQLLAYLNDENLAEASKRHDLTPRGFFIMNLVAKHLKDFPKNDATGFVSVNLNAIRKAELTAEGKDPFRIDDFQILVNLGYATNVDLKSAEEAITLITPDAFNLAFRFQRFGMIVQAVNEQKRK